VTDTTRKNTTVSREMWGNGFVGFFIGRRT